VMNVEILAKFTLASNEACIHKGEVFDDIPLLQMMFDKFADNIYCNDVEKNPES